MIEAWQIILAIIIVGLSIVMPIYYSKQRKNKTQHEEAIERMQIREYGRKINDETRAKKKQVKLMSLLEILLVIELSYLAYKLIAD